MSYKTENWHDKLRQVREHVQEVTTVAIDEAKSMSLDQIKKKYKRELAKLKGSFPKDRSPLQMALLRHAYDHGLIKTDDPDHADQVIDGLLDDMDESVEEPSVTEEIELLLKEIDGEQVEKPTKSVEVSESGQETCPNCDGTGFIAEEVEEKPHNLEKTVEKLMERNMLGRLSKQLQLNEQGKEQLFNYFEKGELKQ